jgi:hypothetical protein
MNYLYKDFTVGRHVIRYVRLPDFPTKSAAHSSLGGVFHKEGDLLETRPQLTTHWLILLQQLREEQRENRLVYFDIDDAQLDNPGQLLADFEAKTELDDPGTWELTSAKLL